MLGLDIGGTFTDVMMVHPPTGATARFKSLTTPHDPSLGALAAIEGVLTAAKATPAEVAVVLHATTLVSNALIERKGAATSLVMTRGFKDTLEIAREKKFDIYDLMLDKPAPLVPPERRFEVDERIAADGSEVTPLTDGAIEHLVSALRAAGAEAVAVCLLHSYMNPAHERLLRDRLTTALPGTTVCVSSDILPELREFERASTTAANAYVQPLLSRYLAGFLEGLRARGIAGPLFIMLSEGAIAAPEIAARIPIRVCESGPAAGAVTAAAVARQLHEQRILSFDMGGTTAKTSVVHDGKPLVTTDFEVARTYRFKKGSGLPLRLPVVDLIEIGAGGGSLARVDDLGLLKVGPESAAADPGPACYARGGERATVTDADLTLGYIGGDGFLGGRMRLDPLLARAAIERDVARHLKVGADQAALGIHEIVNENMANAARVQAIERGQDPAGHVLVAFGGAGPVHAWGVAQRLGVSSVVIPPSPGVGSALGLLLAPRAFRLARTYIGTLDALDWDRVASAYAEMTAEAAEALDKAGVQRRDVRLARSADMRYLGQRKELTVELPSGPLGSRRVAALREAFEQLYENVYHRRHLGHPVEVLCWRLVASGPESTMLARATRVRARRTVAMPRARRPMLFPGWTRYRACPVYSRYGLGPGTRVPGPAAIEEDESSTLIGPHGSGRVDSFGNLIITIPPPGNDHA